MNGRAFALDVQRTAVGRARRLFADEYTVDFNGPRAAKVAGYPESAWRRLLARPDVDRRIKANIAENKQLLRIDSQMVMRELSEIAFSDPEDAPSQAEKLKALELLGKHYGMFADVTKHELGDNLAKLIGEARQRVIGKTIEGEAK